MPAATASVGSDFTTIQSFVAQVVGELRHFVFDPLDYLFGHGINLSSFEFRRRQTRVQHHFECPCPSQRARQKTPCRVKDCRTVDYA